MRHRISNSIAAITLVALGVGATLAPAEAAPRKGIGRGRDTTAPTITCPSGITADAMYSFGAYVTFTVSATDDMDPSPDVVASHGQGWFPVGTTTVTVTATDWRNNTSTETFDVTVLPFTQTILPSEGVRTYKAYWWDADGYGYFEWDITVDANGSVSGTGHQTYLLLAYDEFNQYSADLPSGLSGEGTVSGTIASDGSGQLESSSSYWYWNGFDYDADGNPAYAQGTTGFSDSVTVIVDAAGNLYFGVSPLASPSYWYDYAAWYLQ